LTCVLDASAALSLVLSDEFTDTSERILNLVVAYGAVVPTLWSYQVTNGLLAALRRGRLTEEAVAHAVVGLERLPITYDPSRPPQGELIGVAREYDLTTYDAAYLWLARYRDMSLATRDQRLTSAARKAAIKLVD
jgi:predicted nucleic acid-binding protein